MKSAISESGCGCSFGEITEAIEQHHRPVYWVHRGESSATSLTFDPPAGTGHRAISFPAVLPEHLGDAGFTACHAVRFPYICGEMANGIATAEMVVVSARAGWLGFFGAAGCSLDRIERTMARLASDCAESSWGSNLIHSPNEPQLEEKTVDIYLLHGVRRVSASAFMTLRPSIVRYACSGLTEAPDGSVMRRNFVFAKISRPEVAKHFLSPAPEQILQSLVESRAITASEAALARRVPVAEDVTVEADSGGHTDNRPLTALLPAIVALRDELQDRYRFATAARVGAAGSIGTPGAVSAAFAMGAAYVLTGSINQSARESGLSAEGKKLLAAATIADVTMAPAGDMFEMGVKVQVLKRGLFFPLRAAKLYELYRAYDSLEQIPPATLASIEKDVFRQPVARVWDQTRRYFEATNPKEIERAVREPKHMMALVFRWYLGNSNQWAIQGDLDRRVDYQIWCGPAMGAFNAWAAGSFLDPLENRTVPEIGLNLLYGAAALTRAQQFRAAGINVPQRLFSYAPRALSERHRSFAAELARA
ncbi:MAG TPA: PfaD family polyunsaturated fatty acid/polyketide biosynthesis protein [Bryobacteraceae bacterium]|nr:PfaD family polyunsaturated fatty acid/polyketide biosynthesis protein [Bryobacteraceae bacterium]